jgi:hypothetical protein
MPDPFRPLSRNRDFRLLCAIRAAPSVHSLGPQESPGDDALLARA